jgi:hypothetical protein
MMHDSVQACCLPLWQGFLESAVPGGLPGVLCLDLYTMLVGLLQLV